MVNTPVLPSPKLMLGLGPDGDAFGSWYAGQDVVMAQILDWLTNGPKFLCAGLPTGVGKSLMAALVATLSHRRTAVLTATKGLQDQFMTDFHPVGFRDIRGQNAYPCVALPGSGFKVDHGPCHAGVHCEFKENGCIYYSTAARARAGRFVVTNYSYWLAQTANPQATQGGSLGSRELLILDEFDQAFGALESFLTTHISLRECTVSDVRLPNTGSGPESWRSWQSWAHDNLPRVERLERELRQHLQGITIDGGDLAARVDWKGQGRRAPRPDHANADITRIRVVQDMVRKLGRLRSGLGEWVWQTTGGGHNGGGFGVRFVPVWPGEYANLVYGGADKVMVMSATLTPKTAGLLHIPEDERAWLETESSYPPANTPIRHVKTARVDRNSTESDMRMWVSRIDQIIDRRLDRKGLVMPVSYQRGNYLAANSRHRDKIITHSQGEVQRAVERWRKSPAPSVLVSPSITRGWDFPGDDCRYIVIGKIPFTDTRSPVVKARNTTDKDYAGYEAMQTLVQMAGRGTRSPDDWCEIFITDDNWGWFWNRNSAHAPQFFRDRLLRRADVVPPAMEPR